VKWKQGSPHSVHECGFVLKTLLNELDTAPQNSAAAL